jgi:hypothetical protein
MTDADPRIRPLDESTVQRIAAGEDDELALAELAGRVEELFALRSGEFVRMAVGLGVGPTVFAGQLTGPCHLPDQHERPPARVNGRGHRHPLQDMFGIGYKRPRCRSDPSVEGFSPGYECPRRVPRI